MRQRARLIGVLATAFVVTALTGCSDSGTASPAPSTTVTGSRSAPSTAQATSGIWDPCTGIPDHDLTAAGLDPTTKKPGLTGNGGASISGWKVCSVNGRWYTYQAFGSDQTVDGVTSKSAWYEHPLPVHVGGRSAIQLDKVGDTNRSACVLVIGTRQGAVVLDLFAKISTGKQGDPCAEVSRVTTVLIKDFPPEK